VDIADYIGHLERAGGQLSRSARFAGMSAAIPSCPEWTVADLVAHTTHVHRWVTSILAGGDPKAFTFERPGPETALAVYDEGLAELVAALRSASPTLEVWTFLPSESPLTFWARRQAHETSIHKVDAELAADVGVGEFDPAFAADGLAELLLGFAANGRFDTDGVTSTRTVTVAPLDVNQAWTLIIGPQAVSAVPEARDGSDLTVLGQATDLYRWAWNRAGDDEVSLVGDVTLADLWRRNFTVLWSRRKRR
jgi:uncharacterized protein (TIGR03083 family)